MFDDPFKDVESLRSDVEFHIRTRLRGFHFVPGQPILSSKDEDWALLRALCPDNARFPVASQVEEFIRNKLYTSLRTWYTLESEGTLKFWTMVSGSPSISNVALGSMMLRDLITALVKARDRYVVRQKALDPGFDAQTCASELCDGAAQKVLIRIRKLNDPGRFSGDCFKSPFCSNQEKLELIRRAKTFGPARQISGKSFELRTHACQKLRPISDLAHGRRTNDGLGFIDALVSKPPSQASRGCERDGKLTNGRPQGTPTRKVATEARVLSSGRRRSAYLFGSPTRTNQTKVRRRTMSQSQMSRSFRAQSPSPIPRGTTVKSASVNSSPTVLERDDVFGNVF